LSPKRRHLETAIAVVFTMLIVVVGGTAIYLLASRNPVHTDRAAVPSRVAMADQAAATGPIQQSRSLALDLVVGQDLPALSVAVGKGGAILWAEGFGYSHIEPRVAVTPHTRFRTGSVSKTMTTTALALLDQRGLLNLDAPVQTYVPAYPKKAWTITPRQLMGDVAGVHRIRGDNNDNAPRGHCRSLSDAVKTFDREPLLFEPGTQYRFSTHGWILLSAVIEGAAKEPFAAFVSREVLTPLGMHRTSLEGEEDADDVAFYAKEERFGFYQGAQDAADESYSCFYGAGGFLSTPSDLVRLGSAMLSPGLLNKETITLLQTPLRLNSGASTGFALGWKVDTVPLSGRPVRVVRHRAMFFGGAATLTIVPDVGLVVAAMTNTQDTQHVDPFALQVAEAFAR
jgi:serine beta-lactamase-like protein LACTB